MDFFYCVFRSEVGFIVGSFVVETFGEGRVERSYGFFFGVYIVRVSF